MTGLILFPITRESRARMAQLGEAWAVEADKHLVKYAGWLFPEGVPGWLGEAWWATVCDHRRRRPSVGPRAANWPVLWANCITGLDDKHRPAWQRQVEINLRNMEAQGDAA